MPTTTGRKTRAKTPIPLRPKRVVNLANPNSAKKRALRPASTALTQPAWKKAVALYRRFRSHQKAGRQQEALSAATSLVDRFGDIGERLLQRLVEEALVFCIESFIHLNQDSEAIAAIDRLVSLVGDNNHPISGNTKDPGDQHKIAWALTLKGSRLGDQHQYERGIEAFDSLIKRFAHSDDPTLVESAFDAFINKSVFLRHLDRTNEEIESSRTSISIFRHSDELPMQLRLAKVLLGMAQRLAQLERYGESIAAYAEVIERFESSTHPELYKAVCTAVQHLTAELRDFRRVCKARKLTPRAASAAFDKHSARAAGIQ